ncbi:MAG TPA: hypothetical protein VK255_03060 [Patescibacteria group bacterium]|nr:hypothetical protein [Patescibacteria group bacterium]
MKLDWNIAVKICGFLVFLYISFFISRFVYYAWTDTPDLPIQSVQKFGIKGLLYLPLSNTVAFIVSFPSLLLFPGLIITAIAGLIKNDFSYLKNYFKIWFGSLAIEAVIISMYV